MRPELESGLKGLQVGSIFELIADHCKYRQYDNTREDVKMEASSLVLKRTIAYMIAPITHVMIIIATCPGQPENSMNWKIIQVMFPAVRIPNSEINVIPEQLPAPPLELLTPETRA